MSSCAMGTKRRKCGTVRSVKIRPPDGRHDWQMVLEPSMYGAVYGNAAHNNTLKLNKTTELEVKNLY